jgi:ABC-2 type transport system ATP-binding protein
MEPAVSLRGVGVRFTLPRHSRLGRAPRLFATKKSHLWGLREVTLDVAPGEAVGLIGPNGAGKTTLLRTVGGVYHPDEGTLAVRGRVGTLLSLSAGLMAPLSGWENIALVTVLLGVPRRQVPSIAPDIAEFSGLGEFLDAEVRTYSSGMKARLGFAIAAFSDPDILVIDEVLGVGDEEFQEQSSERVQRFIGEGKTVMVASHQMPRLAKLCSRLLYLEGGRIVADGEPRKVIEGYRARHHVLDMDTERPPATSRP